ncbi:MAG: pilus assembly protein N-terminal domain-containing protein [Planctomycetales bacterium]|nr:pilus assembly protein N-terminal domain-containing protein [Planctomycetales bacterium]
MKLRQPNRTADARRPSRRLRAVLSVAVGGLLLSPANAQLPEIPRLPTSQVREPQLPVYPFEAASQPEFTPATRDLISKLGLMKSLNAKPATEKANSKQLPSLPHVAYNSTAAAADQSASALQAPAAILNTDVDSLLSIELPTPNRQAIDLPQNDSASEQIPSGTVVSVKPPALPDEAKTSSEAIVFSLSDDVDSVQPTRHESPLKTDDASSPGFQGIAERSSSRSRTPQIAKSASKQSGLSVGEKTSDKHRSAIEPKEFAPDSTSLTASTEASNELTPSQDTNSDKPVLGSASSLVPKLVSPSGLAANASSRQRDVPPVQAAVSPSPLEKATMLASAEGKPKSDDVVAASTEQVVQPNPLNTHVDLGGGKPAPIVTDESPLSVFAGQAHTIVTNGRIVQVSVEHPEICSLVQANENTLHVFGIKEGTTRIAVVAPGTDGNTVVNVRSVHVAADRPQDSAAAKLAKDFSATINNLFPDCRVTVRAEDERLIVQGVTGNEDQARKILSLIRSTALMPVVDKLESN